MDAMQFGHALDCILREILLANPAFDPVYLIKLDISDGFYCIALNFDNIPKLGVAFPTASGKEPLVVFPLILPMGWKNSPPVYSTATETIADLINTRLRHLAVPLPHHLDNLAESIPSPDPAIRHPRSLPHVTRDPSLPTPPQPLAYTNIYVDDFVAASQCSPTGLSNIDNRRWVRRLLLHAVDNVFHPVSAGDSPERHEPVSLKKLHAGDCLWETMKLVLGRIINTVEMTISLPPHRIARLADILSSFPRDQRQTSAKRWHETLGEL
jgi:hypothetical protein